LPQAQAQPTEAIPDEDEASRHFWADDEADWGSQLPFRWDATAKERAESFIWRKYAPALADVHSRGCEREAKANAHRAAEGKSARMYAGACTVAVGRIRSIHSGGGYRLDVYHLIENGDAAHVHVCMTHPTGAPLDNKMPKNDRRDLVHQLVETLGDIAPHSCS
jgi:hypothetical protein